MSKIFTRLFSLFLCRRSRVRNEKESRRKRIKRELISTFVEDLLTHLRLLAWQKCDWYYLFLWLVRSGLPWIFNSFWHPTEGRWWIGWEIARHRWLDFDDGKIIWLIMAKTSIRSQINFCDEVKAVTGAGGVGGRLMSVVRMKNGKRRSSPKKWFRKTSWYNLKKREEEVFQQC